MDFYEALVETYLTVIEKCAVLPQVPILRDARGKPWEAYPDFLALDFKKRQIQIVEVTKAREERAVRRLAKDRLDPGYRGNVENYVKTFTLDSQIDFAVRWRFFVREEHLTALRSVTGKEAEAMALEDVFDALKKKMP